MTYELGFLGAGNMAEAIAVAAIGQQVLDGSQIIASDPSEDRQRVLAQHGMVTCCDNARVIRESKQVLLAIKPQALDGIAGDLAGCLSDDQVVISIMAGVTCAKLERVVGRAIRLIRVMPNTPVLVGYGMAGIARGPSAQIGDDALAMRLFQAAGHAIAVEEADLDAITAVSGSGPAYVFYLAQMMQQAAEELGLGQHAPLLVQQTILGAAQLLSQGDDSPAQLRRNVTSPGGTTEAAIRHMEQAGTGRVVIEAIRAAYDRSKELGA